MSSLPLDEALLHAVARIAREAGQATLPFHGQAPETALKEDGSPVTAADRVAHALIVAALEQLTPHLPVLSEESPPEAFSQWQPGQGYWLVDPLDGTKEFLKANGEYTVNVAWVEEEVPTLGVVYVPVTGVTYLAAQGLGAWVMRPGEALQPLRTRPAHLESLVVVASRSHAGPQLEALLRRLPGARTTSLGSSLKFCLLAEARADFYPRLSPTHAWDTAAAHCVLQVAGGGVVDTSGRPLRYARPDQLNPSFLAFGDARQDWPALLVPPT